MFLKSFSDSFWGLLFPPLCVGCQDVLRHQERFLCTSCLYHLPYTQDHQEPKNRVLVQLMGKLQVEHGSSFLYFSQSSIVQRLVHAIKYFNRPEIAFFMGQKYGGLLRQSPYYTSLDLIIPLPLHPLKFRQRGFNQSEYFARGIAEHYAASVDTSILKRRVHSPSQTTADPLDRFDNVKDVFFCLPQRHLKDKKVLLVDDVLTTGSTLASAGNCLLDRSACKLLVATLALA